MPEPPKPPKPPPDRPIPIHAEPPPFRFPKPIPPQPPAPKPPPKGTCRRKFVDSDGNEWRLATSFPLAGAEVPLDEI